MRAVFGIVEHFARFGEHGGRQLRSGIDRAVVGEKLGFAPILPRFERLAVDLSGKANAKALLEMQSRHHHPRTP